MAKNRFNKKKRNKKDNYLYIAISLIFIALLLLGSIIVLISCQDNTPDYSQPEESDSTSIESSSVESFDISEESEEESSEEESSIPPAKEGWVEENGNKYYYEKCIFSN